MPTKLLITKNPRKDPIPDIPISFPPLQNLHLELMEVKEKLKSGLPLIPLSKPPIRKPQAIEINVSPESTSQPPPVQNVRTPSQPPVQPHRHRHMSRPMEIHDEDDDLVKDLGDDYETDNDEGHRYTQDDEGEYQEQHQGDVVEDEDEEYDPYAGLSPEEREEKEKEEYIWRFRILKKKYGNGASIPIPEYNEHSDLTMMKTSYERTIRELYLDDSVETYRSYLLGGWIAIEYVCTSIIGIDLRGFTVQQSALMYKYDRMLIELGEKSHERFGASLPVEVRLLGMILFQAGIFYAGKIISESYGGSASDIFKNMMGLPPDPVQNNESEEKAKKKMRGPKLKASDIRDRT